MLPWSADLAGRMDRLVIASDRLKDNPLGDPYERPLWVYTPPGYDSDPDRRYPSIYVIQGYTGQIGMWDNRIAFRQPFPELADALFARGEAPPAIVVYVDAWTKVGGSQYLDSPGTGAYSAYLCDEIVSFVDERYRTMAHRDHRGISGKSSGGYGAMVSAMRRPDVFGGFATHAGDSLFELAAPPLIANAARLLRDKHGSSYANYFAGLPSRVFGTKDGDSQLMEIYAYAAAYSAEPDGTVRVPFDEETGEIIPEVWERWLANDPVRMAAEPQYAEALRAQRAIWIDAGTKDDYYLDLGATAFRRAVAAAGVPDDRVYFELFEATHAAIEYRYPLALAWLSERLGV